MTIDYLDSKRIVKLSTDAVETVIEDDFSSYANTTAGDAAWVTEDTALLRVNPTNDNIDFKADGSVSSKDKISYDLTSISTLFLSRFSVNFTTMTASGGSGTKAFFGVTEGAIYDATENHIGFWVREQASTANDMGIKTGVGGDWSSGGATTLFSTVPSVTKYYVELKRTSATSITLSLYSDSNYSTLVETATSTISATGSLRYFSIQTSDSSSASSAIIGTFDDFKFYDGVSSLTSKPTDVQDNTILVEKDTARRYWFDENKVSTTGLKAYYKFNESSGDIINQHTTGDGLASADLTVTGSTYSATGKIGNAVSNDGSNDFMVSPSATKTDFNFIHALNQAWSINIWFKKANANDGGITALIANRVGSDVGIRIKNLDRTASGETRKLQLEIDSGSAGSAVAMYDSSVDSFFPNDTDWHMLTIAADNSITTSAMQIYLDGTLDHNVDRVGVGDGGTPEYPMNFAQEGDGTDYGDYTFDETSFWTRKLTSAEVTSLYNSGSGSIVTEAKDATWTMQPTFQDDFSGSDSWTDRGTTVAVSTSNDRIDWDVGSGAGTNHDGTWYDLGAGVVNTTKWLLTAKIHVANWTASSASSNHIGVGLTDTKDVAYTTSQDSISLAIGVGTNDDRIYGHHSDSQEALDAQRDQFTITPSTTFSSATTVWLKLVRNGSNTMIASLYSDESMSTLLEEKTTTMAGTPANLRYIMVNGRQQNVNAMDGYIDDIKFYNGVTTIN